MNLPKVWNLREVEIEGMNCRAGCGACCIAPSISSPIPGMPGGKPAGVRCIQLTPDNRCALFGRPERPAVCVALRPSAEMCGPDDAHAFAYLAWLEQATSPAPQFVSTAKDAEDTEESKIPLRPLCPLR